MIRRFCIVLALAACCFAQDEKPAPTIPDLETTAQASYMKGDYEGCRQTLLKALDIAQMLPPEDPLRYDVFKRLATVRAAVGEFTDADNFLQSAISWRETTLGATDPKIADDLLISVGYARGVKDYDRALVIMNRVLSLHISANRASGTMPPGEAMNSLTIADDFSRMAQIQAEMGIEKAPMAIGSLTTAIMIRTKLQGPLEPSLVYDLDRMAGLQIATRAYDKAEESYRHALVIRETLYGKQHADLISTVDGLAYSLFGQKKYDEADPVYQRLLALWIYSVGGSQTHPMVAMALDKIAVFYGAQNKWDDVDAASTRANAIRAYLLADGLSNQASEHVDAGKMSAAVPYYARALVVLDPPDPIYEQQRANIGAMKKELEHVIKVPPTATPARKK